MVGGSSRRDCALAALPALLIVNSAGCPVLPGDRLGRDARGGAVGGSGWLGGGFLGGSRWFGRWFELIDA